MNSKFHIEREAKFMRGEIEHRTPWSSVDFEEQAKGECYDLWNYADGMAQYKKRGIDAFVIKVLTRIIYWIL